jgi:hypothetical protein
MAPITSQLGILLKVHVDGDGAVASQGLAPRLPAGLAAVRQLRIAERAQDGLGIDVGERIRGDRRPVGLDLIGGQPAGIGQVHRRSDAWGRGVPRVDGQELDRAALHGGLRPVWALGVHIALVEAVVGGVGVDQDSLGSGQLRVVDLDAAVVGAVADQDDLVAHVDAEIGQPLEVGGRAVVGVDHLRGHVARRAGAVERRQDARVVLEGVAAEGLADMLRAGAGHDPAAAGVEGLDQDFDWLVEQNLVGNDLRIEPGRLELLRDVERGVVVFGRTGPVRGLAERLQVLAGEHGVGDGEKGLIPLRLLGEVAEAEDRSSPVASLGVANRDVRERGAGEQGEEGEAAWTHSREKPF